MKFGLLILMISVFINPAWAEAKTADQKLDEKLAREKHINTIFDFRIETQKRIYGANGLADSTKTKLIDLNSDTYFKIRDVDVQYLRLQAVLIHDLLNDYDKAELGLIRKRMSALAERRIETILASVESAHNILGADAKNNQQLLENFLKLNQAVRP